MMELINIQSPLVLGALLGLALGLGTTIPREEKLRHTFAYLFGAMAIASIGGGFYFFSETQLMFLSQFLFSFLLGFVITFLIGLRYRRWRYRIGVGFLDMHEPSSFEIRQIQRQIPKIEAKIKARGGIIFGYKVAVLFSIKNTTEVMLDDLDATLTIRDLLLKEKKVSIRRDLSDIIPGEKVDYTIEAKIGRRWREMSVVFKVRRRRVVLQEFHWTYKLLD